MVYTTYVYIIYILEGSGISSAIKDTSIILAILAYGILPV